MDTSEAPDTEGVEPCVAVTANEVAGWHYAVTCRRSSSQVRGYRVDRAAAITEAEFWMRRLCPEGGCPRRKVG
jgi:hypothetical protein